MAAADDGQRFEDTMAVLEAQREEREESFRAVLAELLAATEAVRKADDDMVARHRADLEARRTTLAAAREEQAAVSPRAGSDDALAWPDGGRGLRGPVNRLARWLMRDYLETVDRRRDAQNARFDALQRQIDRLRGALEGEDTMTAALLESLAGTHRALRATHATHAEMLDLVNAKDAEVLQRAVAGPLRRMELLFEEFGRQQEALLAQLVGRRRELDELVRAVTPAPEEEEEE